MCGLVPIYRKWVNNGRRAVHQGHHAFWNILEHPAWCKKVLGNMALAALDFAAWWNGAATPLERFFKILSRSLGATPYGPGAGGKQNFILIDNEQSIFIFIDFFILLL
jgi:hypothetical protein